MAHVMIDGPNGEKTKLEGEIAKVFFMRGKLATITKLVLKGETIFTFKISNKVDKRDYYSFDKYNTFKDCERECCKAIKGL